MQSRRIADIIYEFSSLVGENTSQMNPEAV